MDALSAKDALKKVIEGSGIGTIAISKRMGKADSFLSMTVSRGSIPKLDTFAEIARACGYELVLRGHDEEFKIEPNQAE